MSKSKIKCTYKTISEHDMDMMFLQLFSTDAGFVDLFLDAAEINYKKLKVLGVELSKTDPRLGESDITVTLSIDSKNVQLLIEDKIDAIAMPEQPDRYIKQGNKAVANGECDVFYSFIVCPKKYYDNNEEAQNYPLFLTYESINEYLLRQKGPMYDVYCQQISLALDKAKKPPQVILNEKANAFFRKYKDYQEENYPTLRLRTKRESNGYWAHYSVRLGNAYIHHKIQEGKADLTFSNASTRMNDVELVANWLRLHGIDGARAVVAGKAGVVHIDVPPLNMTIDFDDNDNKKIKACFDVLLQLSEAADVIGLTASLANL